MKISSALTILVLLTSCNFFQENKKSPQPDVGNPPPSECGDGMIKDSNGTCSTCADLGLVLDSDSGECREKNTCENAAEPDCMAPSVESCALLGKEFDPVGSVCRSCEDRDMEFDQAKRTCVDPTDGDQYASSTVSFELKENFDAELIFQSSINSASFFDPMHSDFTRFSDIKKELESINYVFDSDSFVDSDRNHYRVTFKRDTQTIYEYDPSNPYHGFFDSYSKFLQDVRRYVEANESKVFSDENMDDLAGVKISWERGLPPDASSAIKGRLLRCLISLYREKTELPANIAYDASSDLECDSLGLMNGDLGSVRVSLLQDSYRIATREPVEGPTTRSQAKVVKLSLMSQAVCPGASSGFRGYEHYVEAGWISNWWGGDISLIRAPDVGAETDKVQSECRKSIWKNLGFAASESIKGKDVEILKQNRASRELYDEFAVVSSSDPLELDRVDLEKSLYARILGGLMDIDLDSLPPLKRDIDLNLGKLEQALDISSDWTNAKNLAKAYLSPNYVQLSTPFHTAFQTLSSDAASQYYERFADLMTGRCDRIIDLSRQCISDSMAALEAYVIRFEHSGKVSKFYSFGGLK